MPANVATRKRTNDLAETIERHINGRTWGRVHRLIVEVDGDHVLVRGCTPSYYVKQLAIQGILEGLNGAGVEQLQVEIEVEAGVFRVSV